MTVWTLLMGICFTTSIAFGSMAGGKPVGIAAFLIGLVVGVVAGIVGVLFMFFGGLKYDGWFYPNEQQPTKIQVLAYLVKNILGLGWCLVIGLTAQVITRYLIHLVAA